MKKILFLVTILSSINAFSQKDSRVNLKKGQTITALSTATANMDMGMGMEMKSNSTITNVLTVIADEDKNYRISNTTTKLKISMDMMGQATNYDSEKAEDKNSDMGKELSEKLNVADTVLIDKKTGTVVNNKKDSPERPEKGDDTNPLAGLISSIGGDIDGNAAIEEAFFIIPPGKNIGDSWTDSTTVDKLTKVENYTIKSIDNNIAVVLVKIKTNGEGMTEMQGSMVSYTITTNTGSEITVDIKKGLVNKKTSEIEISGSLDVMGQSMPISSKGNKSVVYQY
ncbi:MAG: DUF6263 family protein [Ferruginibacter sp.]